MIKNKRGFLLTEETLKIVVAVIGLGILVYFLLSIFYSSSVDKKEKDALSSIERISEVVSALEPGEIKEVNLLQPQGWSLFSFVSEDKKPNQCSGESCLCICDEVVVDNLPSFGLIEDRQVKECSESGACLVVDDLKRFEEIEIIDYDDGTTSIDLKNEGGIRISVK